MASFPNNQSSSSFAEYLAKKISIDLLKKLRPLISVGYKVAYSQSPIEGELPYRRNSIPNIRTDAVLEHVHEGAEGAGIKSIVRELSNHYVYLEMLCGGLTVHVKHYSPHENLPAQIGRAKYRQEQTAANFSFAEQLNFFESGQDGELPEDAYVVLFYQDSPTRKDELGDIYFVIPSTEDCSPIAIAYLEDVLAISEQLQESSLDEIRADEQPEDSFDFPPADDDEGQKENLN